MRQIPCDGKSPNSARPPGAKIRLFPKCPRFGYNSPMLSAVSAPLATAVRSVRGREILDSRGFPTVEAEVVLECGAYGRASVPAGASKGSREVRERRDGDPKRHNGLGVQSAARALSGEIAQALAGRDARDLCDLDRAVADLDPDPQNPRIGGNAALAASVACAKAVAAANGVSLRAQIPELLGGEKFPQRLPVPMMNILNGGAHASNNLDIQEFMIVPAGFRSYPRALRAGAEIFHALRGILREKGMSVAVGDEGGFAPDLPTHESALALLTDAVHRAGYAPGRDVFLAVDCAANELRGADGLYRLRPESFCGDAGDLAEMISGWAEKYPVASAEDVAAEDDFSGWKAAAEKLRGKMLLVGDDVFATNAEWIRRGAREDFANALLMKPNQAGSLTAAWAAVCAARRAGWKVAASHRSGETEDDALADAAMAFGADLAKFGAPCRGERTAKYNRLLRIAEELEAESTGGAGGGVGEFGFGEGAPYAGLAALGR